MKLIHSCEDKIRLHGIKHFFATEGLIESESEVTLIYGDTPSPTKYCIRVVVNEISELVEGWIHYNEFKAPLFEKPKEVEGEAIAEFNSTPCVVKKEDEIIVGFDIFNQLGKGLSGFLEGKYPEDAAEIPSLDIFCRILVDCIEMMHNKADIPFTKKMKWPNNAPYAVCLTHDVDEVRKTYQHLSSPLKYAFLGQFSKSIRYIKNSVSDLLNGIDPYWTFETLMKVEEELGVRSSLFFLQEHGKFTLTDLKSFFLIARRYSFKEPKISAIIKKLDENGWDIGMHGSYNSYDNPELFKKEKTDLEEVLGHEVVGTRQHHLNFRFPNTWLNQEASRIKYDCTLGFKNKIGFRWGTCNPFTPMNPDTQKPINILEYPTIIMDTPLFYVKNNPQESIKKIQDTVKTHNGLLTILWHHTVFNNKEFPGWMEKYNKIIKTAKNDGAWITNGKEITEWIRGKSE